MSTASEGGLRVLVAQVAAAYFSNSHVSPADIPDVLGRITASLRDVDDKDGQGVDQEFAAFEAPVPAAISSTTQVKATVAEVKRSIRDDGLVSFEDGRTYKTLKRHLASCGLTPAQYREKWDLPNDYPMVCATSSAKRSALAKQIGLGKRAAPRARKAVRKVGLAKSFQS